MAKVENRTVKIWIDGEQVENSVNGITSAMRKVRGEMKKAEIGSEEYNKSLRKLQQLNGILEQHQQKVRGMGGAFSSLKGMIGKISIGNIIGNLATKAIEGVGILIGKVQQLASEAVDMARGAEGITIAFERLNKPGLLDELRKATHGTVTDLELMKAAVKAENFGIPLEQLGKYFAFAQQRAKDTGESVDYLVDSIVTGLGRKSPMILDNLGISASALKDEMAKGADMATAVGTIIEQEMSKTGDYIETAADRAAQATVKVQNEQLKLGQILEPLASQGTSMWTDIQVAAIKALGQIILKTVDVVNWFIDWYNESQLLRAVIGTIGLAFESLWHVVKGVGEIVINNFKGMIKSGKAVLEMLEGIAHLDRKKIQKGWQAAMNAGKEQMESNISAVKKIGTKIGSAYADAVNDEYNKRLKHVSLKKSTALPTPTIKDTGDGGGGGGGELDKDAAKKAAAEKLARELETIELEHQRRLNEIKKQYADGDIATKEMLNAKIAALEYAKLQQMLQVAGLEAEKREQVLSKVRDMEVKMRDEIDKQRTDMLKRGEERMAQIKAELDEKEKARLESLAEKQMEIESTVMSGMQTFSTEMGALFQGIFAGEEEAFKNFMKNIVMTTINAIQAQIQAYYAGILAKEILSKSWAGVASAAAQFALITAAFEGAKALIGSFSVGGYTGTGGNGEVAGFVHRNEYVVDHAGTGNPALAPFLTMYEQARRSGSVASLTADDVRRVYGADGAQDNGQAVAYTEMMVMLGKLGKTIVKLDRRLSVPLKAETYVTGKGGSEEATQLLERMRRNVARS